MGPGMRVWVYGSMNMGLDIWVRAYGSKQMGPCIWVRVYGSLHMGLILHILHMGPGSRVLGPSPMSNLIFMCLVLWYPGPETQDPFTRTRDPVSRTQDPANVYAPIVFKDNAFNIY